jgi:hypothetical protein
MEKDIITLEAQNLQVLQSDYAVVKDETVELNLCNVLQLEQVITDYSRLRNTVLENLQHIRDVSTELKKELEIEGYNPEYVEAWNSLLKTSNESLKILTESYKNISSVLLSIHKVNQLDRKPKDDITTQVENIAEIIKKLELQKLENLGD